MIIYDLKYRRHTGSMTIYYLLTAFFALAASFRGIGFTAGFGLPDAVPPTDLSCFAAFLVFIGFG